MPKTPKVDLMSSSKSLQNDSSRNQTNKKRLTAKNFNKSKTEEKKELQTKKKEIQFEKKNFWWYE